MDMNDTMNLLEQLTVDLSRECLAQDELYQQYAGERRAKWAAFLEKHPQELCSEVLELIDLDDNLDLMMFRLRFFMGLQLGLELGRLDLLGAK